MVMTALTGQVDRYGIRRLWDGAIDFLLDDRRDDGLFSFSAVMQNGHFRRNYDHPQALRYTINSLLGLQAAARTTPDDTRLSELDDIVDDFAARWSERVTNAADLGLFTVLLCERGDDDRAAATLQRLIEATDVPAAALDVQTLGWAIWGAASAARRGIGAAHGATATLLQRLVDDFVDERTGLARHSARRYRGGILSFGGLVYYLRALHEAHDVLGDRRAGELFRSGVGRAIALQSFDGGWPWMIDAATGRVFDRYPLFAVHQDAMSMLFLHPAAAGGLPGASEARMRSIRWALGSNELGLRMYVDEPLFVAYRAIQRTEPFPRAQRYARWLRGDVDELPARRVHVNRECRSYHLGWLLYAWS
jgi:hypothetical protein